MTIGSLEIVISNPEGERIGVVDKISSAAYTRSLGLVGGANIDIPMSDVKGNPRESFPIDGRIEFWRHVGPNHTVLDTDTSFFIRYRGRKKLSDGSVMFSVGGPSAVDILRRRVNAYFHGDAKSVVASSIEANMKQIVRENFSDLATAVSRRISSKYFLVEASNNLGSTIRKEYAWRNILDVLREFMDYSLTTATPIFFDVVRYDQEAFIFRTYAGFRGTDRGRTSASPVVFSAESGNISDEELMEDYSEEINGAYCGGSGEDEQRLLGWSFETSRSLRGPFALSETFVDARSDSNYTSLFAEAGSEVIAGRPKIKIAANIQSTESVKYGKDWFFGDRAVARVFDSEFDVLINGVECSLSDTGEEKVVARIEGESFAS